MITLVKNGSDWHDWHAQIGRKIYPLKDSSLIDEDLYEIPGSDTPDEIHWEQIRNIKIKEIPKELRLHIFNTNKFIKGPIDHAFIYFIDKKHTIEIHWTIKTENWDSPYNPFLLQKEILQAHKKTENKNIEILSGSDFGFIDLYFLFTFNENTEIRKALAEAKIYIEKIQKESEKAISLSNRHQIIANFEFRSDLQGACSKYLIYFIEFLKDLGIDANSELKRVGNEILFTIEPSDPQTSLRRIKDALAAYLMLPESNTQINTTNESNLLIQLKLEKLNSEIQALKSSIKIQDTLLSLQNSKIESLRNNTANHQPSSPLDGLKSISSPKKTESRDEFLNGFIKLGKFQKLGIEFNWNALIHLIKK